MKLPEKIAFVDVETTGMNASRDRIIEIGIVKTENGKVTEEWQTLVDPGGYLPPEITMLTGISSDEFAQAPTFRQISDKLTEITSDCVIAAHNARFDYSFLKSEYKRVGLDFRAKLLCTVRLSRAMYPDKPRHNLDALCERLGIVVKNRHRAFDDAAAIAEFYINMLNSRGDELEITVQKLLKKTVTPQYLEHLKIDLLPEKPGIYIFYGESGMPLYIGKSINIKERVRSHFSESLGNASEMRLFNQVTDIETEVCAGEFSALVREAELIKKLQPLHNRRLRKTEELFWLKPEINKLGYKSLSVTRENIKYQEGYGSFRNKKSASDFLVQKCRQYNLCEKLMGLERTRERCFKSELGKCLACNGQEDILKYNLRFDMAVASQKIPAWPFDGPIVITEGNKRYMFDQWSRVNKAFDLDTYKIVRNFIENKKNMIRIKNLPKLTHDNLDDVSFEVVD